MKKLLTVLMLILSMSIQAQVLFDGITIVDQSIYPSDAVVDGSGNTYVIGSFAGDPDFDPGTGVVNAPDPANFKTADNENDAFVAKYNSDGTLAWVQAMWTRGATSTGNDNFLYFRDIALDNSGNVYFVGDIRGTADGIGNQVNGGFVAQGESPRAFVRGLSPSGSLIIQASNSYESGANSAGSTGYGIAVDGSGNVYITGEFKKDINGFNSANNSNYQTYYTKFNSSGTRIDEGYLINSAVATYDVDRDNGGRAIEVQDNGSFFITGYFGQNAAFDGSTTLSSVNQKDTYIAYYSAAEALLDVKTFSTAEEGKQVELDGAGNLYLSYGTNITRITTAGTIDWTRDFGYDVAFSINGSDELLVTRLEGELRYLKLLSDNSIDFELTVPFVSGTAASLSSIKAFEYSVDDFKWVLADIQTSNFDGDAPFENGGGIIVADYATQTDFTAPGIVLRTPDLNATDVPLDQVFTVEFDENIVLESGQAIVSIAPTAGGGITNLFEGNPGLSADDNTLTFSTSNLVASTNYQITLYNVQDVLGNEIPTTNGWFLTTGAAAGDVTPPAAQTRTPVDDATDVPLDQVFTITFDEDIQQPTATSPGSIRIVPDNGVISIPYNTQSVTDGLLSTTSNSISFSSPNLIKSTNYYAIIDDGVVRDLAGNPNNALDFVVDWTFRTVEGDITPPQIVSLSPADDATNAPLNPTVVATFDEPIAIAPGESQAIILYRNGSPQIFIPEGDDRITIADEVLTIDFVNDFLPNTNYAIWLKNSISDLDGNFNNSFDNSTTWNFTTGSGDNTKPTLQSKGAIADGTYGSSIFNLTLTFSEEVVFRQATNDFRLVYEINGTEQNLTQYVSSTSDNSISFEFPFNLVNGQSFHILIDPNAVEDLSGNKYDGVSDDSELGFTVSYVGPEATAYSPSRGATNVALDTDIIITFDKAIALNQDATGRRLRLLNRTGNTNTIVEDFEIADLSILDGNKLVATPSQPLEESTIYGVTLLGVTVFEDGQPGVFNAPFNSVGFWDFTTANPNAVVNIPDANFKSYLLGNTAINTNGDTEIQVTEAEAFEGQIQTPPNDGITDLTGVEAFINLTRLNISGGSNGKLTSVDLSALTQLELLSLGGHDLSSIDLTSNTALTDLNLSDNPITSLDVSTNSQLASLSLIRCSLLTSIDVTNNTALTSLNVSQMGLSSLDLSNNTNLENLTIDNNNLSSFDPSSFPSLSYLNAENIGVSSIDFTSNANLTEVVLSDNGLTSLDLSQNGLMEWVFASNNALTTVNLQNGNNSALREVDLTGNSSLQCVLVDDPAFFESNSAVTADQGVSFSTTCDLEAPIANSTSPSDEGTFAPLGGAGGIVFNEAVQQASGTIELYLADGTLIESIPTGVNDTRLGQPADFRITWDFDAELTPSANYYILVSAGAYEDLAGNSFAGIGVGELDFTANARPLIESLLPVNNATDVAVDAIITLDLDEDVYVTESTASLVIKEYATDNIFESFNLATLDLGGGAGSFANGIISVAPTAPFEKGTQYYIVLEPSDVLISSLNVETFKGLDDKDDWTFTTIQPKTDQTITFPELEAKTFGDATFELTATASSNLAVSYASSDETVATLNGSTVTIVGAGTTTITATQEGDETFNAATPVEQTLTVNKADQTITIDEIGDKLTTDAVFDVVAATTSNLALEYAVSGPATNNGATITLTGTTGIVSVTVSQGGNDNYNAASESTTFNVTDPAKADQVITFNALEAKTFGDAAFELTATASSNLAVSYASSDEAVATVIGNTVTIVGAGTATITATQEGDDSFNAAAPVSRSLTVNKADQTITIDEIGDKLTTDAAFDVVATTTSNLAFEYAVSGPATNSGATITFTGESGTVTVTVSQSGNANFNQASGSVSFNVSDPAKTDQTITFEAIEPKTFGDNAFDLTATSSSGLSVVYTSSNQNVATISGNTVTIVGAGTSTITAAQDGNEDFNPAETVEQLLTVVKADQVITIESIADKVTTDAPFSFTASTNSGLALSYDITGPATLDGTLVTLNGQSGTVTITANQAGNDNYNSASESVSFEVVDPTKTDQTITFDALEAKTFGDSAFELTATASSNLAVSYASSDETVATITGSTLTIVGAGTTTITATQEGNETFNAADPVEQTLTVNKADQIITIEAIENKRTTDGSFDVVATTSSDLPLTYSVTGPATISDATITLDGSVGTVTVVVSQAGNENYNSAEETTSFEVEEEVALNVLSEGRLIVYPNPTTDLLFFDLAKEVEVRVFDLNGREVMSDATNEGRLDVSGLNVGNYTLQISDGGSKTNIRFVKKN